jgi:hypothetical protein
MGESEAEARRRANAGDDLEQMTIRVVDLGGAGGYS